MALSRGAKTLALTSTGIALVSLDVTILNVAFGSLLREFGTDTRRELTWLFSGYNIAYAATLLTAGRLADAYGRKKAFIRGLIIFAIGSALCGIAQNPEMLIASRVLQAIGGAILSPASLALVLPEFPIERRSAAIGIWGAVGGLSAALGPVIGGWLIDIANWRLVFFVNVPVCLIAAAIGVRYLKESLDETAHKHVDIPGALLAVVSVGLLALAIVQSDEWGWATPTTIGILIAAAVATAAFVATCRRSTTPVLDLRLLKLPFVTASTIAGLVFSAGFFAMIFVNTQWLQAVWGYGVLKSGWCTVPGPFMAALVAAPAGRAAQRFGHGKVHRTRVLHLRRVDGVHEHLHGQGTFVLDALLPVQRHQRFRYRPQHLDVLQRRNRLPAAHALCDGLCAVEHRPPGGCSTRPCHRWFSAHRSRQEQRRCARRAAGLDLRVDHDFPRRHRDDRSVPQANGGTTRRCCRGLKRQFAPTTPTGHDTPVPPRPQ